MKQKKRLWGAFLAALVTSLASCNKEVTFSGQSADKLQPKVVVDKEFPAGLIGDTTTKFKPPFGLVEEQLTLKEQPPVTSNLKQIVRDAKQDAFKQGHDGASADEKYPISSVGKLDLVLVVDDSSSMDSEQTQLQTGLASLLSSLANVDWQIVVTTSDASEPCIRDYNDITNGSTGGPGTILKKADYDADPATVTKIYQKLATPGAASSGNERTLFGARRALDQSVQATCKPNNWTRPGSALAVLVVTDEDNCHSSGFMNFHHFSVNTATPNDVDPNDSGNAGYLSEYTSTTISDNGPNGCATNEYNGTDLLTTIANKGMGWVAGQNARFYGIYWPKDTFNPNVTPTPPAHSSTANEGWSYDNLVAQTHGTLGSLDKAFTTTLTGISSDVAKIIKHKLTLGHVPASQSVVVTIDGQAYADFSISGNTLNLNNVDPNAKNVEVTYKHDATPKFDFVTLSGKPAPGTLVVTVAGTPVDPTKLTYDDATGEVHLVDQPTDDADVVVKYRKNVVLPSTEDLTALTIDGQPLSVTVDGKTLDGTTYDATTHTLAFKDPPTDGAAIAVTYKAVGGHVTHYAAPAAQNATLLSMAVTDTATAAPLNVSMSGGDLVFDEKDVVDGRQVTVTYDYGDKSTVLSHDLSNTPMDGTLQVHVDDGSPDCLNNVTIVGTKVTFTCDAATLGEVAITYKYIAQHYTTFTLDQDVPAGAYVQVFVDGQALDHGAWTQSGRTFSIAESLTKIDSKVRILASTNTTKTP